MNWRTLLIGKWSWKRPFQSLAFIYLCLAGVAWFFADWLIFLPPPPGYADEPPVFKVRSARGDEIALVHLPASDGMPTLLYSHGNAEDLAGALEATETWHQAGCGVMAYDYPGYGHSSGRPTEESCNAAIEAAWRHLVETRKVSPSSIVLVGRSVGAGPAVRLATREQPAGLLLVSPFTSAFRVQIPFPLFPGDRFPNLKLMPRVGCPLLVIHGERDSIVPPAHGRRLVDAHRGPDKSFVGIPGCGHNDLSFEGDEPVDRAVMGFVRRVAGPPAILEQRLPDQKPAPR